MKTIVAVSALGLALVFASSGHIAKATQYSHIRKAKHHSLQPQQFWNSKASLVAPSASERSYYSGGWSAPAGH